MTVVYDLLGFQNRDHGERGIARYVLNLALAIERRHPDFIDQYLVHPHVPLPSGVEPLIRSGKIVRSDRHQDQRRPSSAGLFISGSLVELQEPLDVVLPTWARTPSWRTAGVLYDLIPLRYPDWYLTDPNVNYPYRARVSAYRSLDHVLAISQATADDANELLGIPNEAISVIWAGADGQFRPPSRPHRDVARTLSNDIDGLREGYIMFPSGIERRKNIDRLLEAYAGLPRAVRQQHQLALVCRVNDDELAALDLLAEELGITDDLVVTGYVSDAMLVALYQGAELVVFPSLYEGFGLPPLEAMMCGAPVICSDTSSLREVQRDPERRFDPTDVDSIRDALSRHLPARVQSAVDRQEDTPPYTWERAADITVWALSEPRTTITSDRPSIGLVTPLPPQASGIATYARRLVEHLQTVADITVFVDLTCGDVDPIDGVRIEPLDRLGTVLAGGGEVDHLVYFMGNSTFHVEALDVLKSHPGSVLFHDARMTGLYGEVQRLAPERLDGGSVGATLATLYPHRYRPAVEAMTVIPPDQADRFGVLMAAEIMKTATRGFVHSAYAADLLEFDTGTRPEVLFPIPGPAPTQRSEAPSSPPVVATFGIVAPVKCPELLIDAFALVRDELDDAELWFVGGIDPPLRELLEMRADKAGVLDGVRFTGHVSDEEFAQAQADAHVAVQLRSFTNGESSAAVSETMAVGLPTIVSDVGAMAELPRTAVAHFDHDCGPEGLAAEMLRLLQSDRAQAEMRRAALGYARSHQFETAAQAFLRALERDPHR